jgi:hypothetical protein
VFRHKPTGDRYLIEIDAKGGWISAVGPIGSEAKALDRQAMMIWIFDNREDLEPMDQDAESR